MKYIIIGFCLAFGASVVCAALAAGRGGRIANSQSPMAKRQGPIAKRKVTIANSLQVRVDRGMIRLTPKHS